MSITACNSEWMYNFVTYFQKLWYLPEKAMSKYLGRN